ncbi:MAG: hypothetical protein ABI488_07180 [Polyangiaceae bacterium]
MFTLRRVFAFVPALLVLVFVGRADAQTATLTVTTTGVTHSAPRNANRLNTFINKADCVADDVMTFPINATNFGTYAFQAWVGTGCDATATRKQAGQTQCWKVVDTTIQAGSSGLSSGSTSIKIHVRDIVTGFTNLFGGRASTGTAGTGGTTGTGGTGGTAGTDVGGATSGGDTSTTSDGLGINQLITGSSDAACDQPNAQNVLGATTLTIYFMLLNTSTGESVATAPWAGSFKLVGPPAPDIVSAGVGGNLLVVNFKYSATPSDQTGNGFYVYCDPPSGSDAAADAGLLDDAGRGTTLACGQPMSSVLVAGNDVPTDPKYRCGTGQKTSQTASATGLVNNVAYNVAVAAVDIYENVGPLSPLDCKVPQPITGFYKAYRDAGGTGGGGFCSFSTKHEPVILITVFGLAIGLVFRRRRSA